MSYRIERDRDGLPTRMHWTGDSLMTHEDHAKVLEMHAQFRNIEPSSLDAAVAEACVAGAAALRQQAQTCEWREEEYGEYWESACGETWTFIEGGPAENKAVFCHGCGQRIQAIAYDEPLDAEDVDAS